MPEKKTPPGSKKQILIIEDERPLAHALELKLQHEGFDTAVALNGEDGLEKALAEKFDLILLDLIMPKIDGFTVLQELKDHNVKTAVIVLSNLGQDEDQQRAKTLGAVDYFVKANTPIAEIIKRMQSALF